MSEHSSNCPCGSIANHEVWLQERFASIPKRTGGDSLSTEEIAFYAQKPKKLTYWEELEPPMSFIPEKWTLQQKRDFRYQCIPYLPGAINAVRFRGQRVLCVGDGSGIDAVELAKAGAIVSVVDMSEKAIEITRNHFQEAKVGQGVKIVNSDDGDIKYGHVIVGDACALPESNGAFDAVYSFGVIHHIPEVEKAVKEIARVLKPGGLFFGMVYNKDSLLYAYSILARGAREGLSPEESMRMYSERNPGCPHSVAYTHATLGNLLANNGFFTINTTTKYDVVDLPEKRKVPFDLGGNQTLGWHLWFEATK